MSISHAIIRVAAVEDDAGLQNSLKQLLTRTPGLEAVGIFRDGETAVQKVPGCKPDVVIMDINLPGINGVECVRQLKQLLPRSQFLMLTVYEDSELLFDSLMAGATGYLLKRTPAAKIVEAIRDIHGGGSPMTPAVARRVVRFLTKQGTELERIGELTDREHQCLEQLAQGYRYKEVADNLNISMGTVRTHIRIIYEKLHVHSRTEAVVKYLQQKPTEQSAAKNH
jgi:DNA-binding NarL/FixJ family response regulator